jgi:hypothetical protein
VYDLHSGKFIRSLNPKGETSCAARFNPAGTKLLITSEKVARLYDTVTSRYHDLELD